MNEAPLMVTIPLTEYTQLVRQSASLKIILASMGDYGVDKETANAVRLALDEDE